jgi:hypothetical protein
MCHHTKKFVHHFQAIIRQIHKEGLIHGLYETDANFRLKMRHLSPLAFVPAEHGEQLIVNHSSTSTGGIGLL